MAVEKFTARLSLEGSTGSVRGKIPATLVAAMGGKDGDVIEFEVNRGVLVGGRMIKGREAQKIRSTRQDFGRTEKTKAKKVQAPANAKPVVKAPVKLKGNGKTKVVAKTSVKPPTAKAPVKVQAPVAKPNKRKTKVKMTVGKVQPPSAKSKPRFRV